MYDLNKEIVEFHNTEVSLNANQQSDMRKCRDANRNRLKKGLKDNDDPSVKRHVAQGSYAMHTMIQDKNNDYDIDDGAVFDKEDLKGKQDAYLTSLDVRKMVRDAVDDDSFKTPPEVKTNCVRVHYDAGYHVDIPVYRELEDGSLELASSCWKGSSPTEVTEWYNEAVIKQSPDTTNGRQMRRNTKLLKSFSKSRTSWKKKVPSGLVISVLLDEKYVSDLERDDKSLYDTMVTIRDRLNSSLQVCHPVRAAEELTSGYDDAKTKFFREKLDKAISDLEVLFDPGCTRLDALQAWNKVFDHQFFKDLIEVEKKEKEKQNFKTKSTAIPTVIATKPWLNDNFDTENMAEIQQYFPELKIKTDKVCGKIEFYAKYAQNHRKQWIIESCELEKNDCVHGKYKIEIALNRPGIPLVFETGGKITSLAHRLGKKLTDFHINNDGSCCLDFSLNISQNLTASQFILNKVYPFFVWQAYYEKFEALPPVGEYSHGKEVIEEFYKDITSLGRNDLCTCGSGKKFKKCCLQYFGVLKAKFDDF